VDATASIGDVGDVVTIALDSSVVVVSSRPMQPFGRLSSAIVPWFSLVGMTMLVLGCGTDEVLFPDTETTANGAVGRPVPVVDAGIIPPSPADGSPTQPPPEASLTVSDGAPPPAAEAGQDAEPARGDESIPEPPPLCAQLRHDVLSPACTALRLPSVKVTASNAARGDVAQNAFDGDPCTAWDAGASPPQWLKFEPCSSGKGCESLPRISRLGLYVDGDGSGSVTVELQGATAEGAKKNAFHTMSSQSFGSGWVANDYREMTVGADAEEVMRVMVNSGPSSPVIVREVVLLSCP